MKNRTGRKRGMLSSVLFSVSPREFFSVLFGTSSSVSSSISDGVPDGERGSLVLKWVPVLDRYGSICVYGAMDIYIKASGVLKSVVCGIPLALSSALSSVYVRMCSAFRFFQVGVSSFRSALRTAFVDGGNIDIFKC